LNLRPFLTMKGGFMNQCPNGHRFPDSLMECPVCARDNELKTVYAGSVAAIFPVCSPSSPLLFPNPGSDPDVSKTVILGVNSSAQKINLAGWLVLLDIDGIPIDSYKLFNRKMTIGRNRTNDIVISDDAVSGTHCTIEVQNGKFVINDNGSSNKTLVDGIPVTSCTLEEQASIELGRSHFKIKYAF
jgi:pSer/pThr/pTyr-binding forkhead associated (FHA) protein